MPNISPVLLREEIARRLRAARVAAGIKPGDAAAALDLSRSSLCRTETGQQRATVHLVRSMMDIYDFRDDELLEKVRAARKSGWWKAYGISDQDFVALETGASRASEFSIHLIPGLLQTADYAQAMIESSRHRSETWMADALEVRLIRQDRLTDEASPIQLVAVLQHLALVSELPTVTLQLLPTSVVTNDSSYGSFTILDFSDRNQPSIAYVKHAFGEERSSNPEVLHRARMRFDHLRSLALDPDRSVAHIERVGDELWSG